ncbi:MAG: hypothetical protein L6416_08715, partial [Candidatus Omnitrophica bacterium]|nr:hypothetical protein [Candidatus Omnitrophota bacterium]
QILFFQRIRKELFSGYHKHRNLVNVFDKPPNLGGSALHNILGQLLPRPDAIGAANACEPSVNPHRRGIGVGYSH